MTGFKYGRFVRKAQLFLVDMHVLSSIIENALFYAVVCWGSCTTDKNCRRLDKLVKKASSVVGRRLDPLSAVVAQRMRRKLYSVLDNNRHPLHSILAGQRSSCSERLISLRCRTERFRRSFVRTAISVMIHSWLSFPTASFTSTFPLT